MKSRWTWNVPVISGPKTRLCLCKKNSLLKGVRWAPLEVRCVSLWRRSTLARSMWRKLSTECLFCITCRRIINLALVSRTLGWSVEMSSRWTLFRANLPLNSLWRSNWRWFPIFYPVFTKGRSSARSCGTVRTNKTHRKSLLMRLFSWESRRNLLWALRITSTHWCTRRRNKTRISYISIFCSIGPSRTFWMTPKRLSNWARWMISMWGCIIRYSRKNSRKMHNK